MKSPESPIQDGNMNTSKNPNCLPKNIETDSLVMSELVGEVGQYEDAPGDYVDQDTPAEGSTETRDQRIEKANFDVYKAIWENEKAMADISGVNPETGCYEKGRSPISPENIEFARYRRGIAEKLASDKEKLASDKELTFQERLDSGRDGVVYKWEGYELKKDCCYRKINKSTLRQYQESGFVGNNIDLKTLNRESGPKIKGRKDTVDWFLGATTPRYGDILIETPALKKYFVPVEKPGEKGNLLTDTEAIHMHSSGIVDPIPTSDVRVIIGGQAYEIDEID